MKAFALIVILIGSFSVDSLSGFLAVACGLGIIAVDYVYGK